MKEQEKKNQKTEEQRVSVRFFIKNSDRLEIEKAVNILKKRGWKQGKEVLRIKDFIIDALFSKTNSRFYDDIIKELTPLEYLYKEGCKNPKTRLDLEKLLKRKTADNT
ncbi:MAG: hypothetical protein OXM55_07505 [Bdellovibrionales bacterium]|nr:hypothetical protein [Bdellovibrionales bacterium]